MAKRNQRSASLHRNIEKVKQSWSPRTRQARLRTAVERQQKLWLQIAGCVA